MRVSCLVGALSFATVACATVSGLQDYSVSCSEGCADAATDASFDILHGVDAHREAASDGTTGGDSADGPPLLPPEADIPADVVADIEAAAGDESADGTDAAVDTAGSTGCDAASCPGITSSATAWACGKGGCNSVGGGCSGPSTCHCASDGDCGGGKCVKVTGHNDVSCGSSCTGSGPTDGFDCQLGGSGIPSSCSIAFGYTPSNFSPASYASLVPAGATTIGCDLTYDSNSHAFTACNGSCTGSFCAGATPPAVMPDVAQTVAGGPNVDILVFAGLTLNGGNTLTITNSATGGGGNAVVLAVFGDASIAGTIRADASGGASGGALNTNTPGASGPGGDNNCVHGNNPGAGLNGGPTCSDPMNDCRDSGGGGGGASATGGAGAAGVSGSVGAAGAVRASGSVSPLTGGCPGGTSGGWACTTYGGGGGGAVQISAAGTLTVSGTITANGGGGGTSTCSASFGLCGITYGGGGGGGGSGGAVLLEGQTVSTPGSVNVNGGHGGDSHGGGTGGAGGTSSSTAGKNGSGSASGCGSSTSAGGGGGGSYGYLRLNGGQAGPGHSCVTTLTPAPVCPSGQGACLCAADTNCPSGKCVNTSGQCTGPCTGSGPADSVGCQVVASQASAYSCSTRNCSNVTTPTDACDAAGIPCYCTSDRGCASGRCVDWAGCASGACTGSGAADSENCAL